MSKNTIYKIKIKNWGKYNNSLKKGHKSVLISTGFLTDAKIQNLKPSEVLLFLGILLVAGELTSGEVEVSTTQLQHISKLKPSGVRVGVDRLQELQLVTYQKVLLNRIEEKGKEENRIPNAKALGKKKETQEVEKISTKDSLAKAPRENKTPEILLAEKMHRHELRQAYARAFTKRYRIEAPSNAKTNAQFVQLQKRLGKEAGAVIAFYLSLDDKFLTENHHPLDVLVSKAETYLAKMRSSEVNSEEIQKIESLILQFLEENSETISPTFLRNKNKILNHFGNADRFVDWANAIITREDVSKMKNAKVYKMQCLRKECQL